jgi:endo-1,4-beta-xylanase
MKATPLFTITLAILLVSCGRTASPAPVTPTAQILPQRSVTLAPTPSPAATDTPTATLPPTLTPLPASATPRPETADARYHPLPLSPADQAAYDQAQKDLLIYRQGDLHLTIQDQNGSPLPGYQVSYHQTSHDFLFAGISNNFDTAKQRGSVFNTWSMYMDWSWLEPELGKFQLEFVNYWLGIDELKSGGLTIRTNALYSPGEMLPYYQDVPFEEFLKRLHEHVATAVKRFAPSVDYWEAVLEPNFGNHNPFHLSKDQYYQAISTSIQAIRENDPTAQVEINFSYPCGGIGWLDNFQIVQEMLDRKIDFDLVGLQFYYNAYIGAGMYQMPRLPLNEMSACYDKYEKMLTPYGKRVVGSEFSVPSDAPAGQTGYWNIPWSEDTQAQYLVTGYTIFFAKPSNMGLTWWNTFEPSPFVYHGGLVAEDGTPKKSYLALSDLLQVWTTTGEAVTDSQGGLTFRGFAGDYEIEVTNPANGALMRAQAHITEQKSASQTIAFQPNAELLGIIEQLRKLTEYWHAQGKDEFAQKGDDYLALVNHHLQLSEWALADQTASAALDELAIIIEAVIPLSDLKLANDVNGQTTIDNDRIVLWGSSTLYYAGEFPPGTLTLEVQASSQAELGEFPTMVLGIGDHYSPVQKITNDQVKTFTLTTPTRGSEKVFTIRVPYDAATNDRITAQKGDVGELKLFIHQVKLIIKTVEIPK